MAKKRINCTTWLYPSRWEFHSCSPRIMALPRIMTLMSTVLMTTVLVTMCLVLSTLPGHLHAQRGPDPTAPPGGGFQRSGEQAFDIQFPRVEVVLEVNGERRAYIAGRWRFTNETVAGMHIESIQSNGVRVSTEGKHYFLPVVGHGVDKNRLQPKEYRDLKSK